MFGNPDTFEITPPTRDGVPRLFPKKTKDTQMNSKRDLTTAYRGAYGVG